MHANHSVPHRPIFLADDHELVRAGIRALIELQPGLQVVGEASDGDSAYKGIRHLQSPSGPGVDVATIDIAMPNGNGMETTARIKQSWPYIRVVAFSMHSDLCYVRKMMEAGASGYVLKSSPADELIRAIHAVAAGSTYLDPALSESLAGSILHEPACTITAEGAPLSDNEKRILTMIAQGFNHKEIAASCDLSVKTIETYKRRAMDKLALVTRTDIIRYAMIEGWLDSSVAWNVAVA